MSDAAEHIYFMPAMADGAPGPALDQIKVGDYLQALGTRFRVTEIRPKPQPDVFVPFFSDDDECAECDVHMDLRVEETS